MLFTYQVNEKRASICGKIKVFKVLTIPNKGALYEYCKHLTLESNRQIKINFDGGDLSSDAGLLLIKEFISKLGIDTLLEKAFKTNDPALFRYHSDPKNLLQMIYMIIAGYFEDDASDELTNDPVFKSVLEKDALASQPTVSRFFNRMDEDTLNQFLAIARVLRRKIYSIQMPQAVILDLDSTLLDAYGSRKAEPLTFTIRAMVIIHLSVMME